MKTFAMSLCILSIGLSTAPAAEHLWDNFDAYDLGSIAAVPGWSAAAWLGTQTAQVSAAQTYSPSNALELPWHANGFSAVYTNFTSTYDPATGHPVIRWSAKLFLENTNTPFQIGLRNSAAGAFLAFRSTAGTGTYGFNAPIGAVPVASNRFVDVTGYYNRSNNTYRLDCDNTYAVPWTLSDSAPDTHTQFNQFVISHGSTGPASPLFVDDVGVETFPPHVWAWWRCTPQNAREFNEQLGGFQPTYYWYYGDEARRGTADPVWDGTADVHNGGAIRLLVAGPMDCVVPTPVTTNWTLEVVFRMSSGDNVAFLEWGKGLGFSDSGARIALEYQSSQNIAFRLRDREEATTESEFTLMAPFVPDGRWHHVALIKSNATAHLYLDYQPVANQLLGSLADGTYSFGTDTHASIGMALNGGNSNGPETLIDEVRLSGKALALSEFLQPGQPLIVAIDNSPATPPWKLTAKCIFGKSYRLETSPALGSAAAWLPIPASAFTSAHTFSFVNVPDTTPKINFVRLVRED
ncbi:MAG: hypothetical protein EOM72_13510 [Opitutae bacterium]|nr:hypothetical protein [Opitutae bacterium]